jgi:hypothetical protein
MKKTFGISALVIGIAVGVVAERTARAQTGPSNQCYGLITSGIASTWPWAHNDKVDFPPPPGSLALWIKEFGPVVGVSSVRDLQQMFCDE